MLNVSPSCMFRSVIDLIVAILTAKKKSASQFLVEFSMIYCFEYQIRLDGFFGFALFLDHYLFSIEGIEEDTGSTS